MRKVLKIVDKYIVVLLFGILIGYCSYATKTHHSFDNYYIKEATDTTKGIDADSIFNQIDSLAENEQLYHSLNYYSSKHKVPKKIAFGIAYYESGYRGLRHCNYTSKLKSHSSLGAMQIKLRTANKFRSDTLTENNLKDSLKLNVETSMIILSKLKNRYGNWHKAIGAYSSGKPRKNYYSRKIMRFNLSRIT
jgi:soluble lytic murein transglycosylase-like protein